METDATEITGIISQHLQENRPHEGLQAFLKDIAGRSFSTFSGEQLAALDAICQQVLPKLLDRYVLWLVNHPHQMRVLLAVLNAALAVNYHPAATLDQIVWLRCLLALSAVRAGKLDAIPAVLGLVAADLHTTTLPEPNGQYHRDLETLQLTEPTATELAIQACQTYFAFLHRASRHELANDLETRLRRLLSQLARDELRPGVVQALFYEDDRHEVGHDRFVHVLIERFNPELEEARSLGSIAYVKPDGVRDPVMLQAAEAAFRVVDAYLKRNAFPDGLDGRRVVWEIANRAGDETDQAETYRGGSIGLPLAMAILSAYFSRPVANDVALTGAIDPAVTDSGMLHPVDGIVSKLHHAVQSHAKVLFIPTGNRAELDGQPALQHLLAEYQADLRPIGRFDEAAEQLFPPEGSGRLVDFVKDTAANIKDLFINQHGQNKLIGKVVHQRHRVHVWACMVLTALLVLLEGWKTYYALAPGQPAVLAWGRVLAATGLVLISMMISFALPAACLRHRKTFSWYIVIVITALGFIGAYLVIHPMVPGFVGISLRYNFSPVAGVMKNLFVMWIFAWAIAANTFHAVAALESLISRRQFVTTRKCLSWDSPLEGRMPLRCVHFPWIWGVVCIAVVAAFLLVLEIFYYGTLDSSPEALWETCLGFGRDLLFIVALSEVMVFYKIAMAKIRQAMA